MMKKLDSKQKKKILSLRHMLHIHRATAQACCVWPVLAEADHAAVVLVAAPLVQHAGVDDVSDGNIQVIGAQVLEQLQSLIACWLNHQDRV